MENEYKWRRPPRRILSPMKLIISRYAFCNICKNIAKLRHLNICYVNVTRTFYFINCGVFFSIKGTCQSANPFNFDEIWYKCSFRKNIYIFLHKIFILHINTYLCIYIYLYKCIYIFTYVHLHYIFILHLIYITFFILYLTKKMFFRRRRSENYSQSWGCGTYFVKYLRNYWR